MDLFIFSSYCNSPAYKSRELELIPSGSAVFYLNRILQVNRFHNLTLHLVHQDKWRKDSIAARICFQMQHLLYVVISYTSILCKPQLAGLF